MAEPTTQPMWSTWSVMFWFVLFFGCLTYEIFTGINHGHRFPMLTQVVVRYVPEPAVIGFILWLLGHFWIRYHDPAYMEWLKAGGAGG